MVVMAITLPYAFDTSGVVKLILRGVLGLLLVVLLGILYSLLVSHSIAAAVQLLLVAALIVFFGRLFYRNLIGSRGTISADAVVVEPDQVFGVRLPGPVGRFSIGQFDAMRVDRIRTPSIVDGMIIQAGPHERVSLVGKSGTPDILVARTADGAGRALGNELAAALKLPYQEQLAPY
jgi:hypothetical protein